MLDSRADCASSIERNLRTPPRFWRGEIILWRAQCRKKRPNASCALARTGAVFISWMDLNFSTGILLFSQFESLSQNSRIPSIDGAYGILLQLIQGLRGCHTHAHSLHLLDLRFDRFVACRAAEPSQDIEKSSPLTG